jgi:hypothetical protein
MLKRNWLWLILLVVALVFDSLWPDLRCDNRIQVGMTYSEAERILDEYGFVQVPGGGVESGEATLVFERPVGWKQIVITVSHQGRVTSRESGRSRKLERIHHRVVVAPQLK